MKIIKELLFLAWTFWTTGYYIFSFFSHYREKILSALKFFCNG